MNDFTKDELEIIYLDMTIYAKKATPLNESRIHLDLRNKIQTLINNYCDHDFDRDSWINDAKQCKWYPCKKCDGYYRYTV